MLKFKVDTAHFDDQGKLVSITVSVQDTRAGSRSYAVSETSVYGTEEGAVRTSDIAGILSMWSKAKERLCGAMKQ